MRRRQEPHVESTRRACAPGVVVIIPCGYYAPAAILLALAAGPPNGVYPANNVVVILALLEREDVSVMKTGSPSDFEVFPITANFSKRSVRPAARVLAAYPASRKHNHEHRRRTRRNKPRELATP